LSKKKGLACKSNVENIRKTGKENSFRFPGALPGGEINQPEGSKRGKKSKDRRQHREDHRKRGFPIRRAKEAALQQEVEEHLKTVKLHLRAEGRKPSIAVNKAKSATRNGRSQGGKLQKQRGGKPKATF